MSDAMSICDSEYNEEALLALPIEKPPNSTLRNTNQLSFLHQIRENLWLSKNARVLRYSMHPDQPEYEHYMKVITNPIDLYTIKKRIENYYYDSAAEAIKDLNLMIANCYKFYHAKTEVHRCCRKFESFMLRKMLDMPDREFETALPRLVGEEADYTLALPSEADCSKSVALIEENPNGLMARETSPVESIEAHCSKTLPSLKESADNVMAIEYNDSGESTASETESQLVISSGSEIGLNDNLACGVYVAENGLSEIPTFFGIGAESDDLAALKNISMPQTSEGAVENEEAEAEASGSNGESAANDTADAEENGAESLWDDEKQGIQFCANIMNCIFMNEQVKNNYKLLQQLGFIKHNIENGTYTETNRIINDLKVLFADTLTELDEKDSGEKSFNFDHLLHEKFKTNFTWGFDMFDTSPSKPDPKKREEVWKEFFEENMPLVMQLPDKRVAELLEYLLKNNTLQKESLEKVQEFLFQATSDEEK